MHGNVSAYTYIRYVNDVQAADTSGDKMERMFTDNDTPNHIYRYSGIEHVAIKEKDKIVVKMSLIEYKDKFPTKWQAFKKTDVYIKFVNK